MLIMLQTGRVLILNKTDFIVKLALVKLPYISPPTQLALEIKIFIVAAQNASSQRSKVLELSLTVSHLSALNQSHP